MTCDIAVVVTAHDQGALVREAVGSALAQTRRPAEVVVVDDGSADAGSRRVLDELAADGRARVLRRPNGGVAAARNAGIVATSAPWVAVLDGDDRWEPDFLVRTAALLDDPDVVAASS